MKIAHLCLSCFYIDGHSYQENILVRQNVLDGHDVKIIASTESIDSKGKMIFLESKDYLGTDGAFVYRVPYNKLIPKSIQHKVRSYENVINILNEFQPDIIYFHGISAFELKTIAKYKKKNPSVKLIADCHSDRYNSALNIQSKILHKYFYKPIFKSIAPSLEKIFCISLETMDFALDYYDAPKDKVEFYPLGGECISDEEYEKRRAQARKDLNIKDDKILLVQTGKINKKKKLVESLYEFSKVPSDKFVYLIIGSLDDEIKADVERLIAQDSRVRFLGWANNDQLKDYLCASDLYVQPGSQSATMQQSLCLRNPVLLDNVKSHTVFVDNNGWLINSTDDICNIIKSIDENPKILSDMSKKSLSIAEKILSYKILASKIYI